MKLYWTRISKRVFYRMGGFANSSLFRKMYGGVWHYYQNALYA